MARQYPAAAMILRIPFLHGRKRICLAPAGSAPRRSVVLSYLTAPFGSGSDSASRGHTNWQECRAMARSWVDAGYRVHVINYDDTGFRLPSDCRFAIDIHSNLERWAGPVDCTKILHATGAHWLTQNAAELGRLKSLRDRRGVSLAPRRLAPPSAAIETANIATYLGNEFTASSFAFAGKKLVRIPISSACDFPFPEGRDWERCRRKFVWLGSFGMVHKGLDLVLEAFSARPDLQLTICGRPEKEEDFWREYTRELTTLPNISLEGWVDIGSPRFQEILRTHGAVIYPSCSEGGGGSVIHCMHGGLVPVVTAGSSVDVMDFGFRISGDTVGQVSEAAAAFADTAPEDLESRSREAWAHVRNVHTLDSFHKSYADFVQSLTL